MIAFFPKPYPDELFSSVVGRCAKILLCPAIQSLKKTLFNRTSIGVSVDFPYNLGFFVENLYPNHSLTVERIINEHSLLPFFRCFLPRKRYDSIVEDMVNEGSVAGGIQRVGIQAGETRFVHKNYHYCPLCVDYDRKLFGETYWHRTHQIACVSVCPTHKCALIKSNVLIRENNSFLQTAEKVVHRAEPSFPRTNQMDFAFFLADQVNWLFQHIEEACDLREFQKKLINILISDGLASKGGLVRTGDLKNLIQQKLDEIEIFPDLGFDLETKSLSWLEHLLRESSHPTNPCYYLIAIYFLGISFESVCEQPTVFLPFGSGPWVCENKICPDYKKRVIDSFETEVFQQRNQKGDLLRGYFACPVCGYSYTANENMWNRGNCYAESFRISDYGWWWRKRLRKLWFDQSLSVNAVSEILGVKDKTVKRYAAIFGLSFDLPNRRHLQIPQIKETKNGRVIDRDKLLAFRDEWEKIRTEHPEMNRLTLESEFKREISWLRRHDNLWLKEHLPEIALRFRPVDWDAEDKKFVIEVGNAITEILSESGKPIRITKAEISRRVSNGYRIQADLNRLPRTQKIVEAAMESIEEVGFRRIEWATFYFISEREIPSFSDFVKVGSLGSVSMRYAFRHKICDALKNIEKVLLLSNFPLDISVEID